MLSFFVEFTSLKFILSEVEISEFHFLFFVSFRFFKSSNKIFKNFSTSSLFLNFFTFHQTLFKTEITFIQL